MKRRFDGFRVVLACVSWLVAGPLAAGTQLTLLSFNTWGAGLNDGKPIDETVAVLRAADADLIGLQEMRAKSSTCTATDCPPGDRSVAGPLAAATGLQLHEQRGPEDVVWACAILSRFPIVAASPNGLGVVVDVAGRRLGVFNIHPTDYPYQPYQLLDIPYGEAPFLDTADAAVAAAAAARGEALRLLREDLAWAADTEAQVIFGDFNEPSHRDWSARAAAAGSHPLAVEWPLVRALEADGFVDALRRVHPDEMAKPAYTWTPITRPDDPADHHDRIDFVLVRGEALTVVEAGIVGEKSPEADLVVTPWPSDHRAVRVVVRLD
ncbi:MAG: endonuclease/exonuclease/phosphatase family protein [Xanthomonadales bacterium]|nr:endonuclease/exonuclease/phosphatase family protein [Xanthomonadales bacterium]